MFVVAVEFVVDEDHVDAFRQQVLLQAANSLQLSIRSPYVKGDSIEGRLYINQKLDRGDVVK